MNEIRDAGQRASTLTRQLLAFSRCQVLESRPLDMGETLAASRKILEWLAGPEVDLRLEVSPGVPVVKADPAQIEQLLWSLVSNAREAVSGAGTIGISLAEAALNEQAGRYVRLSVRDSGCGTGTGLGLSTVHGIVHQCGGFMRLENAPGRGSTFDLFFPAAAGREQPGAHSSGSLADAAR